MRILHLGKFYPPSHGGMERYLDHLARAQAAGGDEVLVLAHGNPGEQPLERPAPGLTVRRCATAFCVGGYAPVAPGLPLSLALALRRFRPEVVHVHAPNPAMLWAALWTALPPLRAPLVLHWHADVAFPAGRAPAAPVLACWRGVEALALRRARAVIATSRAYAMASAALAPHADRLHIVPSAIPDPGPDAAPLAPDDRAGADALRFLDALPGLRVVAVGRLAHYKGFEVLLRALERFEHAGLCLVGEGEQRRELETLAARPELAGRVQLAGALSNAALDACLRKAHVLCLPSTSRSEAFGLVLLEAMARGLPCVASDVAGSGMAEVLGQGEAGLLVPPGDTQALALALARLDADAALRETLGRAGRQRYLEHYDIVAVERATRAVYAAAQS